jgi:glycosyltransferase involved in cell wall biosynthesis
VKICALVKYPPIQGGVSARCYWLARSLADRGHEVHVVTHADQVELSARIELLDDDLPWLEHRAASGGSVTVTRPEVDSRRYAHIPQGPMFTERLAGLAADVVRARGCDVILSYYFQPFGVAAHLAAAWTGVPYTVQHAGSDLGRLMNQPDVTTTYTEVLRRADGVCTRAPRSFLALGVRPENLYCPPGFVLPRTHFHPDAPAIDPVAHIAAVHARGPAEGPGPDAFDRGAPTVGIYGKLGEAKGSYDLLAALGRLHARGLRFNFLAMTRGREMQPYRAAIREHGLERCTFLLPFIPHHKVPGFLRACDVVAFLERDFPITFHSPSIPTEVMATGTCLVLSGEIAAKQPFRERLRDRENVLLVPDPRVHDDLVAALEHALSDPARARAIGRAGAGVDLLAGDLDEYGAGYEAILADLVRRRRGEPSAVGPQARGLPATRAESLRSLAHGLWQAYGPLADHALAAYLAAPPPPADATPQDDAARFCEHLAAHPPAPAPDGWDDVVRLLSALTWLATREGMRPGEGPFARRAVDLGEERGAFLRLAPLRTRWLRVEEFTALPPAFPWRDPSGTLTLAFHKEPNMRGHYFQINRWTRDLLARCDGRTSVAGLIEAVAAASGQPVEAVAPRLRDAVRGWYVRGLVTFVTPG